MDLQNNFSAEPENDNFANQPLMPKGKASVVYKGCMRRSHDKELYERFLTANGWEITPNYADTDLLMFDTCGVTNLRSEENMAYLNRLKKILKPTSRIVVCGCAVKSNEDIVSQHFDGDTFGPREKAKLNELLNATVSIEEFDYPFLSGTAEVGFDTNLHFFENFLNNSIRIKVNEGCLNNCSFCGIKDAIGYLESTSIDMILSQLDKGLEKDYRKVCLISEDVAAWGIDLKTNVSEMIAAVLKKDKDFHLGLFDMNPRWVIKYWEELKPLFFDPRLKEFLLPVQSGSNRILELMKRHHEVDPVHEIVDWFNSNRPDVLLGASAIVGYPTETRAEADQTVELLKGFTYASVSWFSPINGKKAAEMDGFISDEEMDIRAKKCQEVTHCRVFA